MGFANQKRIPSLRVPKTQSGCHGIILAGCTPHSSSDLHPIAPGGWDANHAKRLFCKPLRATKSRRVSRPATERVSPSPFLPVVPFATVGAILRHCAAVCCFKFERPQPLTAGGIFAATTTPGKEPPQKPSRTPVANTAADRPQSPFSAGHAPNPQSTDRPWKAAHNVPAGRGDRRQGLVIQIEPLKLEIGASD